MKLRAIFFITSVFLLTSACATTVRLEVLKPAEIDMRGARIVAMPEFRNSVSGIASLEDFFSAALINAFGGETEAEAEARRVARYATHGLTERLLDTGYFTIVSPREIRSAFGGQDKDIGAREIGDRLGAEAIIVGEILIMKSDDKRFTRQDKVYDERLKKKVKVDVPWVERVSEISLVYRVVETRGGTILATKRFRDQMRDEKPGDRRRDLPGREEMYRQMLDRMLDTAARQLAPHVDVETRSLMDDSSKDPSMKEADELVKKDFLDEARDLYLRIWQETGHTAAGFNGAILFEARGDLGRAIELMGEVVDRTQDETAFREYERLQRTRDERRRAEEQLN